MRQKYLVSKDSENNLLTITEFANLDRDPRGKEFLGIERESFSILCKKTYDGKKMKSATRKGKETVLSELRTDNMFPIGSYADKIAEFVIKLYETKDADSFELLFDDKEFLEMPEPLLPE